jgi:transcriptional regulator with XRE-family HTH domain
MYRLVTRMSRAHYRRKGAMTEDRIFAFFNDALRLELELGIHFEIFDSSAQIGSVSQTLECLVAKPSGFDKEELLECEVKAYLPHDYLTSWRDWIGRKTGLTPVITDLSPVLKDNRSDLKKLRFDINSWGKGHKLFAEEAGISAVTLSLYLNGRTKPHPDTVKNIQAAQERINLQTKLLTETKRDNSQYKEEDSGEEADTTSYHDDQPTTNSEPDVQEEARQA